MKLWQGRFSQKTSNLLDEFNASINFDKTLYKQDINGSIIHAKMLAKCKIIKKEEAQKIIDGLLSIKNDIENDKFKFKTSDEDLHMAIETRLSEIIGKELGGKLHTARSRNDQVALDFRLFVLESNAKISTKIYELIQTLNNIAKNHIFSIMPGYTHLQRAQPISLAYHLLAYCFMFIRDFERFKSSIDRNNICPLGSAALAGSTHKIDREFTAKELGFKSPSFNAMDSVSDRDFAIEILFNISLFFTHTSRLCEEIILWASSEFNFINISDNFSTGSSIMPQKKNPDVAELIRGKTGRVYGNLISLLTTMKALPLAYNKDMQEDKEGVFDSIKTALDSLEILKEMLKNSKFNTEIMKKACEKGHLSATDLADYLVREKNIPFRDAHFIVGKAVAKAQELNIDLAKLSDEDLISIDENLKNLDRKILDMLNCMEARNSFGATSSQQVKIQIENIDKWLTNNNFL